MIYPPQTLNDRIVVFSVVTIMRRNNSDEDIRQHISKVSGVEISDADWSETQQEIEHIASGKPFSEYVYSGGGAS